MRRFIASLDVGSSEIKLVVGEVVKSKINVLACVDAPARGIKKGYVINSESATESFLEVFKKAEDILGIPIKKVIATVPASYTECFLSNGTILINSEDKIITNNDIIKCMQACVGNKVVDNREVITILPTGFKVNDEVVSNPLKMVGEKLSMKSIVVTLPKKNIAGIQACLEHIGIELIDVGISPLADYYEFKQKEMNKDVGAIINIGEETTTVSIMNHGILTNVEVIDIGGDAITNDLAYIYKISKEDAAFVKEHLALAHTRLAQANESLSFTDKHGDAVKINQYDASDYVMGRLVEIINLAKKQINLLTKKEISYIILTGGVAESQDFDILVEELLGNSAIVGNVLEIGARNNKYGTAIGLIKYYNSRLKLRNIDFSIFNIDEQATLGGMDKKVNVSEGSLLGKLFGYFFDN